MGINSFSPSDFMANIDNLGGPQRSHKFIVEVTPPTSLNSSVNYSTIEFLAMGASIPARTLATTSHRYGGQYALEVPYETTYENVALKFMNTNDWKPRTFWNDWFNHIQNMTTYNIQYYKKLIGTVKISVFDDEAAAPSPGLERFKVTLHEAWPKTISNMDLGWESSEISTFDVDMQYSWWTSESSGTSTFGGGLTEGVQ